MTNGKRSSRNPNKPRFDSWNLVTATSALRIFQAIGSICALFLVGSVGSHFSATYAVLTTATMASIISPALVLIFAFNLHTVTTNIDWIFWESIYAGFFGFLFIVNSITMTYSSIRWEYTAWWLGTVVCFLVGLAFIIDLIIVVRVQIKHPYFRHSQSTAQRDLPTTPRR
ncbi:hypothetical protein RB195_006860 [Necator americanus]|uniref:MARVEL domain-containing protein n=1 Tax=Necator americanus TaxID=51031 RepID=A0ABR1BUK1_NECAM